MIHTTFLEAMRSQPEVLRHAEERFAVSLAEFPASVARWRPRDTIGVLAMGASHHSAHAFVNELREHGFRAVNAVASELSPSAAVRLADHYVVVTESGRSPEPIEAARHATIGRRLVITNDPDAPVREIADATIELGGFPDSRAYTAGYTTTLLAYSFLLGSLGVGGRQEASADDATLDRERMSSAVANTLAACAPAAAALGATLAGARHVDVVGSGVSFASAAETALLVREALRIPASAFHTHQYMHGPMESVDSETVVILFGGVGERRAPSSLAGSVADAGARCITIGADTEQGAPTFAVTARNPFVRAACEVVVAQLLIASAIEHKPFDIETFVRSQPGTKV